MNDGEIPKKKNALKQNVNKNLRENKNSTSENMTINTNLYILVENLCGRRKNEYHSQYTTIFEQNTTTTTTMNCKYSKNGMIGWHENA